ncbi:MAG: response regulator [Phycisphaerales bacterium]|nr:response regulator [Phycisphaerales bacterium]
MNGRRQGRIRKAPEASSLRMNTVGMSQRDLDALLAEFDRPEAAHPRREFSRWKFRALSVEMLLRHASGTDLAMRVATRNLSCGGASVLHNAYVHLDTPCTLVLPKRGNLTAPVEGRVVRCEHRQGIVHELGVRFNQTIRMRDFCGDGPLLDRFSFERVDPATLVGTVLVISNSALQHKTISHFLRETKLRLRFASSCAAAMAENLGSVDLVIADWKLPDGATDSLLHNLRSVGYAAPFIVAIPPAVDLSKHRDGVAPEAYLGLPLKEDCVLRAVAEFLLIPGAASVYPVNGGPTADCSLTTIRDTVAGLTFALRADDGIGCYSACMTLRELGESALKGQVSNMAAQAALALGESLDLHRARPHIEALIASCLALGAGGTAAA